MTDIHQGFHDADRVAEAEALFSFLDQASALESVRAYRQHMLELSPPEEGDHILDIGCGVGHSASSIADKVGKTGFVTGIDKSELLITEAERRAGKRSGQLSYQVGDARRLPFADGQFDQCRAERVLMYVEDAEQAVAEMVRVLRPGGRFALFEFDYECIFVDAPDREMTRRLVQLVTESVPSPWIGRQLPQLLRARGAEDLTVVPHALITPLALFRRVVDGTIGQAVARGELDVDEVGLWWRDLERSDEEGTFFAGFFGFIICGRLTGKTPVKNPIDRSGDKAE